MAMLTGVCLEQSISIGSNPTETLSTVYERKRKVHCDSIYVKVIVELVMGTDVKHSQIC